MTVEIKMSTDADGVELVTNTYRPRISKKTNQAAIFNATGEFVTNSRLDAREWQLFDREITEMARVRMEGINDLRSAGLVRGNVDIGITEIKKRIQSERAAAQVTMDTETRVDRDRVDRKVITVPLPVIHEAYKIGERELRASRNAGVPLDTTEAREAAQSVAETLESILFNGTTAVTINGNAVKGYLNATGQLTDTATNFGGGDFGTVENGYKTVKGVLGAFEDRRFRGPFMIYLNSVQYFELLNLRANTDTRDLDLIQDLPQVRGVRISPHVTAGTVLVVQMSRDVVELYEAISLENREWMEPNRSAFHAQVMTVAIPVVQYNYVSQTGIAKVTGA